MKAQFEKRFELKTQLLGHRQRLVNEGKILNRIVRATKDGWEYEADQRHGEYIIQAMGLSEANGLSNPGEESKPWQETEDEQSLDVKDSSEYRALAARANFLALDRADIQFAVKEICATMSNPTRGCKRKLKRHVRYLIGVPKFVSKFKLYSQMIHHSFIVFSIKQ